jgi:hypothetical protein
MSERGSAPLAESVPPRSMQEYRRLVSTRSSSIRRRRRSAATVAAAMISVAAITLGLWQAGISGGRSTHLSAAARSPAAAPMPSPSGHREAAPFGSDKPCPTGTVCIFSQAMLDTHNEMHGASPSVIAVGASVVVRLTGEPGLVWGVPSISAGSYTVLRRTSKLGPGVGSYMGVGPGIASISVSCTGSLCASTHVTMAIRVVG